MVHEPEILILDEPTSGVDPPARDRFWELLVDLSRNRDVTIFVSTHFMNEALRCDRISLMDSGRVLATDASSAMLDLAREYVPGVETHILDPIRTWRSKSDFARTASHLVNMFRDNFRMYESGVSADVRAAAPR